MSDKKIKKMSKSLGHWVFFELICTLGALVFLLSTVQFFNHGTVPYESWHMWTVLIIVVRVLLLFKLWWWADEYYSFDQD